MNIIHDRKNKRFVLPLESDSEAFVEYVIDENGKMKLTYSYVATSLRGQGVGKELVLKTFEKLTEEGFEAIAICSYIRMVAARDPKWSKIIQ